MFKPILLSLGLLVSVFATQAATPLQMVFETSDGNIHAFTAKNLTMKVENNALKVFNGTESTEFGLSTLKKMYFSSGQTGIALPAVNYTDKAVEAYTPQGILTGTFESASEAANNLPAGVYILKSSSTDNGGIKIRVK